MPDRGDTARALLVAALLLIGCGIRHGATADSGPEDGAEDEGGPTPSDHGPSPEPVAGVLEAFIKTPFVGERRLPAHAALSGNGHVLAIGRQDEPTGAPGVDPVADDAAPESGAVYVYRRGAESWALDAFIKATDPPPVAGANFGYQVALDDAGEVLAVSALGGRDSGRVYVYEHTEAGGWAQQASLPGPEMALAGVNLAISGDGRTLAAHHYRRPSDDFVSLYRRVEGEWLEDRFFARELGRPDEQFGMCSSPGCRLALDRNGALLAIGLTNDVSSLRGVGEVHEPVRFSGAVRLMRFANGAWSRGPLLKAPEPMTPAYFGFDVSVSASGRQVAVSSQEHLLRPEGDLYEVGAVYLFAEVDDVWVARGSLPAISPISYERFGYSISMSADGRRLAVGASGESSDSSGVGGNANERRPASGGIHLYRLVDDRWQYASLIKAANPDEGDALGYWTQLSDDGRTIAGYAIGEETSRVGIDIEPNNDGRRTGAFYVYRLD